MPWSREIGFLIFIVIVPLLLLGLQFFLFVKLRIWIKEQLGGRRLFLRITACAFLLFNLAFVATIVVRPSARDFPLWFKYAGMYPFLIWHASSFFLGLIFALWHLIARLLTVGRKVLQLIPPVNRASQHIRSMPHYDSFNASRRTFLRRSALGLTGITVAGTSYGMFIGRHDYELTREEFPIKGLPSEFDGFTIGLISDVHSGAFMLTGEMREYVKIVNDLDTDLIAVPGDFVNGRVDEVFPFVDAFSELRAPYGAYGVLGNHDFYSGDHERIAKEVTAAGIRVLRDENLEIIRNGSRLTLVGVDDVGWQNRAPVQLDKALTTASDHHTRILLCHRPYYLGQAASRNVSLVLSGHTHGGQIVFGKFGNTLLTPAAFVSSYVWGKYSVGATQMYVSRGIGTVGLPVRIHCPPEVTKITLRSA
jgi:hypothetical protein